MTLKELILKRGAVHVVEAIDIMKQVISGISKAHQLGIIHRDLKPQNILVTEKEAKLPILELLNALSAGNLITLLWARCII